MSFISDQTKVSGNIDNMGHSHLEKLYKNNENYLV